MGGHPPAGAEPRWSGLYLAVVCQLVLLGGLVGIWLASDRLGESPSLFAFFLYSIPSEFLVSLAPHEPAVLYVAQFHAAWLVALVAGAGTLVAETFNFEVLRSLPVPDTLRRVSNARLLRWIVDAFGRAPFFALWIAGFVPVVPFTPLRALVLLHRYPRGRYLAAAVSSRTARFYCVALAGAALRLSSSTVALLFAVLAVGVTAPGVYRVLVRGRTTHRRSGGDRT